MENKINIAEILKDCPQGMELDCATWENVTFEKVVNDEIYIKRNNKDSEFGKIVVLNRYGCVTFHKDEKCRIFPKGKTTWEGFQRPFKDGDVLSYQFSGFENRSIYIYMYHRRMNTTYYVAISGGPDSEFMINDKEGHALNSYSDTVRFATEEEKQKLFDAIKANGYKWNEETKTLEKLPKFKVGDIIKHLSAYTSGIVVKVDDKGYHVDYPKGEGVCYINYTLEKDYELAPDKFDITTLKPYDKVLVRGDVGQKWTHDFFGFMDKDKGYPFVCVGHYVIQCIPYEGNEHLLDTTDDCDNFYKTWVK